MLGAGNRSVFGSPRVSPCNGPLTCPAPGLPNGGPFSQRTKQLEQLPFEDLKQLGESPTDSRLRRLAQ